MIWKLGGDRHIQGLGFRDKLLFTRGERWIEEYVWASAADSNIEIMGAAV